MPLSPTCCLVKHSHELDYLSLLAPLHIPVNGFPLKLTKCSCLRAGTRVYKRSETGSGPVVLGQVLDMLRQCFEYVDQDGSGFIDAEELAVIFRLLKLPANLAAAQVGWTTLWLRPRFPRRAGVCQCGWSSGRDVVSKCKGF